MQRIFDNKQWLMATALALFITGCWNGSSNNNSGDNVNPNSAVPTVISTTPADLATDAATNGNVTATFSEAMDAATITASTFTLMAGDTPVAGEVTYAGTVATFNPSSDLAPNTLYTATISTAAKDMTGDALTTSKIWTFTTGTAPSVSSILPADFSTDVAINRNVIATFSEAMDGATLTATSFTLTSMEGDTVVQVPGEVTYAGNVATFNPTADLAANKEYTATLTTAVKDLSGDALQGNVSWRFTTGATADITAPTISSTVPADAALDAAINGNITVTFSEAMDASTITPVTFTVMAGSTPVLGVVTYVGNIASFNPAVDLAPSTSYTATITTGAKDLAGNAFAMDTAWNFTTGTVADTTAPATTALIPFDFADNAPSNGNITAEFSEAMDPATINTSTFMLMEGTVDAPGANVPGEVSYIDNVATFNPASNLSVNTVYTAIITPGVKDLAGNAVAGDITTGNVTWHFTVAPTALNLGAAGGFAILTNTGITDTDAHASVITGDAGSSPISGAAIGIICAEVTGTIYSVDAAGPLPCRVTDATLLTTAVADAALAYTDAAGRTATSAATTNVGAGTLSDLTLTAGVYEWGSNVSIPTDLTFNGSATDVWILKVGGNLDMAANKNVILSGGALAKNIFWQVAGGAGVSLGAGTHFEGIVLAKTKVALGTNASVNGRLLAQTEVTLQANAITQPAP